METKPADSVRDVLVGTVQECVRLVGVLQSTADVDVADEAAHDLRKLLKECRALQRLFRRAMGRKSFRVADRHLRDAGRILADYRRVAALEECIERLLEAGDLSEDAAREWSQHLGVARGALSGSRVELGEAVLRELSQFEAPPIAEDHELRAALKEDRVRMQEQARLCESEPNDVELHQLRKRVKTCRAQLKQVAPESEDLPTLASLGSTLGELHDLAELEVHAFDLGDERSRAALRTATTRARNRLTPEVWERYAALGSEVGLG
jgi:CHAD domain-containing protein